MLSKYSFDIKIKISRKETHVCAGMSIHQVICVEPRAVCIAVCNRISVAHARAHSTKHLRTSAILPRTLHCALRGSRRRSSSLRIPPLRRKRQPREYLLWVGAGCFKLKLFCAYVSYPWPLLFCCVGLGVFSIYSTPPPHPVHIGPPTHIHSRTKQRPRVREGPDK